MSLGPDRAFLQTLQAGILSFAPFFGRSELIYGISPLVPSRPGEFHPHRSPRKSGVSASWKRIGSCQDVRKGSSGPTIIGNPPRVKQFAHHSATLAPKIWQNPIGFLHLGSKSIGSREQGRKMAMYHLAVPYCYIGEIRSPRNDTLVASMGLRVMNAQGALHMDYPTQSKNLGDHRHHTTVAIDLSYSDVDVPDPTPELPDGGAIYWTLVLTNSAAPGAATDAEKIVVGLLQALADKQIDPAKSLTALIENIGLIGLGNLLGLLTPGRCDGIVGALNLNLTARELAQMTPDPVKVNCPGTDSPIGCGSNSNYDLYYVTAPPPPPPVLVTVPNLLKQSPGRARQLAEEAGLLLRTSEEKILPRGSSSRVDSQDPAPGTQVEQGTTVTAVIALPVEGLPP